MTPASRSGAWTTKSSSSPASRGTRARGLFGQGHEDVGRGRIGPALEQAGQQQVALLPPGQLLVVLDVLGPGQQALGLELDEDGGHQQELGELVEVDQLPLVGEDAHEAVDHGHERHVEHVQLVRGHQVQEQVDRALERRGGHRVGHQSTLPNVPPCPHAHPRPAWTAAANTIGAP